MSPETGREPLKPGERVELLDGRTGIVVATHPTIDGYLLVQPDAPSMRWLMEKELLRA